MFFFFKLVFSLGLTGAVFIYENLNLSLIWICHVSFMFVKLTFPFHARSLEAFGYKKCILAVFLVVSLLVPIVPVATIFGTNGFAMVTFPPFFCFPKNGDATYYSLTLPITVILAIGTAMLVIIIWNVHKVISSYIHTSFCTVMIVHYKKNRYHWDNKSGCSLIILSVPSMYTSMHASIKDGFTLFG